MSDSCFNKIFFLFFVSLLFLNNVICQKAQESQTKVSQIQEPQAQESQTKANVSSTSETINESQIPNSDKNLNKIVYYETNFLISNIENLNKTAKTCSTLDECPIYASSCSPSCESGYIDGKYFVKCTPYNVCNFEFKCRANYPCLIKFNSTSEYEFVNSRYQQQNINKTSEIPFFNEEFMLGNQVIVDMNSCYMDPNNNERTYGCSSNTCTSNNNCYSRNCDKTKGRCRRNDKIREYYCKPFNGTIACKLDNQQSCTSNDECASGVCDYIGICLPDYNEDSVRIYNEEVTNFFVLVGFIFATLLAIISCSCYCTSKIGRNGGRKNRRLED